MIIYKSQLTLHYIVYIYVTIAVKYVRNVVNVNNLGLYGKF